MKSKRLLFLSALGCSIFTLCSSSADTVTWQTAAGTWQNGLVGGFDTQFDNTLDSATFGNTGVGVVNISGTVNPTSVLISNTTGSYTFTGGTISGTGTTLTMNGAGGTATISNTTTLSYTGDTTISAGTLQFNRNTSGTHNMGSGTVRLQGGTLKLSGNIASGTITVQNNFAVNASGGTIDLTRGGNNPLWGLTGSLDLSGNLNLSAAAGGSSTGQSLFTGGITVNADATINAANLSNSDYTLGSISGAASRTLTLQASGTTAKGAGKTLAVAATNSFDGTVLITGPSALSPSSGVLFSSAASTQFANADIVIRGNGLLAVNYAVAGTSDFSNVTAGVGGGIKALGASGSFVNLGANTLNYVGEGGALVLDNGAATNNNRLSDTAVLALNSNQIYLNGREANTQTVTEDAGAITFAGGSGLTLRRDNNTSNVVNLQVDSLTRAASSRGTFTIGVVGTDSVLGTTANLKLDTDLTKHSSGMASPTIVESNGHNWVTTTGAGPYTVSAFTAYTAYVDPTTVNLSTNVDQVSNITLSGNSPTLTSNATVYALRVANSSSSVRSLDLNGNKLTIGSGGIILARLGSASVNISGATAGSELAFAANEGLIYNNNSATISAPITGSGGLTKFGAGILTLSASNTSLTGAISVNEGTLNVSNNDALNGQVVTLAPSASLTSQSTSGSGAKIGGLSGYGTLSTPSGNNGSFEISVANSESYTHNGTVTSGGSTRILSLTKSGAGTQIFNGDASLASTITVSAGTLLINGNWSSLAGAVNINAGTLGGTGTIGGAAQIAAAAIHAPGTGAGIQKFTNNLTYADASIFSWDIDRTKAQTRGTGYDAVNVTGTLAGLDGMDDGTTTDAIFRVVIGDADFSDAFWTTDRSWADIFTAADGTTARADWATIFGGGFEFYNGAGIISAPTTGSFSISGNTLNWGYSAIPEPTSALAGLLIGAGLLRRRRTRA